MEHINRYRIFLIKRKDVNKVLTSNHLELIIENYKFTYNIFETFPVYV